MFKQSNYVRLLGGACVGVCQSWLRLAQSGGWFPKNVARNSHVNLSNFELTSLELQRFQALLKVQAIELRATFGGSVRPGPGGPTVPQRCHGPQQCHGFPKMSHVISM